MADPTSVIVRTLNSAATLPRTLQSIAQQTSPYEIIVVDSGSQDDTLSIARQHTDRIVTLSPSEFSYGRSLNRGVEAASGDIMAALSSHCVLPAENWFETARRHIESGAAGIIGASADAQGHPLPEARHIAGDYVLANPFWGVSNHASVWSRAAWESQPFNEDLVACEDREWSFRVARDGGYFVADPHLVVGKQHRRAQGLTAFHQRLVRENLAMRQITTLAPLPLAAVPRELLAAQGRSTPMGFAHHSRPLGRTRAAEVLAYWRASKQHEQAV